ncbi:hypothetical protein YC2023_107106 [Brassica napus]|uniref:(rape) hypothetical protein n=1 Tax=Brassica napus TaxID=3708 RepID=A0A816NY89_BRANA|nr:unnamed protein product [Brassica napus]
MKSSIFFIVALFILSCKLIHILNMRFNYEAYKYKIKYLYIHDLIIGSSSMIMGINDHEDHCHDYRDCEIWCKQFVPEPKCINHICDCKPPPSTSRRAFNIV